MKKVVVIVLEVMVFNATFNNNYSYIVAISFIGGENPSTWRKPPTCCKPQTRYHIMFYQVHLGTSGIRTHTYCIGQTKYNHHMYSPVKNTYTFK